MKTIRKLTKRNEGEFFNFVEVGEVFTYSSSFSYDEVEKLALKNGYIIQYCNSEDPNYRQHGCFTCKVIGSNSTEIDVLRIELLRLIEYKEGQYAKAHGLHDIPTALRERNQIGTLEDVLIIIDQIKRRFNK